jgi:hypothetical protein
MAYHYIRTRLSETVRPGTITRAEPNGIDEAVWKVEVVARDGGAKRGELLIGVQSGSTHLWKPAELQQGAGG